MKRGIELKEFIVIDEEKYYHYSFGGKYTATKFLVINGLHWYNSNKPPQDGMINVNVG
jgi:hypothetical protein